jgi:hypothetical protein
MHPDAGKFSARWQTLRDALFGFVMNHGQDLTELVDAETVTPTKMFPRSRQTWGPLLTLAHLFDGFGVDGLLASMQQFASERAEKAEASTIDEVDEYVLKAFVALRETALEGAAPTSASVQAKATQMGLDAGLRLTAAWAGKILRRYGIRQGSGRSRRAWFTTDEHLAQLVARYGIDLPTKNTVRGTPETASPFAPSSPAAHLSPRSATKTTETGDTCDDGNEGAKGDSVSGVGVGTTFSGKVTL